MYNVFAGAGKRIEKLVKMQNADVCKTICDPLAYLEEPHRKRVKEDATLKRKQSIFIALMLVMALCLGACGGEGAGQSQQAPTPESAAQTQGEEAPAGSGEPQTISIMTFGQYCPGGDVHPLTLEISVVITELYEEYAKRMPNVTLEFETLQGDTEGYTSYLLRGSSGTLPDISMLDGFWVAAFASQGYTTPLEKVMTPEQLDTYYDQFRSMYGGETHGLTVSTAFNGVLWYRKSHLEEKGLTMPPPTWDAMREYAQKLTVPDERYGLVMPMAKSEHTTVCLLGYYWGANEDFVTTNNLAAFNNPTSVNLFGLLKGMYDDKSIPEESLTMMYDDADRMFCTGMASMLQHGSWLGSGWEAKAPDIVDDIGMCELPPHPDTGISSQNAGGWGYSVTTKDESKYAAIQEWLNIMLIEPEWASKRIAEAGEIPVTNNMDHLVNWLPEEYAATTMAMLPTSRTRPAVEIYPDASIEYCQAMQEVVTGAKDAETALADAAARVEDLAKASGWA